MEGIFSEDPRITKTREALVNALMDLVAETSWEAVTVAAVCRRARIHRATFYAHYENKADLIARSLPAFYDSLTEAHRERSNQARFVALFRHCRDHAAFYRRALTSGAEFRTLLVDYLCRHALDSGSAGGLELKFSAGGVVAAIEAFVAEPNPSPEDAAERLVKLLVRPSRR